MLPTYNDMYVCDRLLAYIRTYEEVYTRLVYMQNNTIMYMCRALRVHKTVLWSSAVYTTLLLP